MTWLRKTTGALGLLTLGALCVPGCADNDSMLFIHGVLSIERTDCVAKPDSSAILREGGTLDLALAGGYRAALLVGSQLTQRGSRERLRTETARLVIRGADITLEDAYERPLALEGNPNPFSTVASGIINPAAGTEPGLGVTFLDIIPSVLSSAIESALGGSGLVLAKIKVYGETFGNQKVESGDFLFPIQVCRGCLISYPATSMTASGLACDSTAEQGSTTDTVCFVGQDKAVPCTSCAGVPACDSPCNNCIYRATAMNDANCAGVPAPTGCNP